MPGIKQRRKTWVSTSEDSDYYPTGYAEDEHDGVKRYCVKCEGYGFPYQELGERIYKDEELINGQAPHDADLWRQCYRCGSIVSVKHAKQEGHIKGFIDIPKSIHEARRLSVEHFIKPRKLRERTKSVNRSHIIEDSNVLVAPEEDKDIQNLTDSTSGKELANYSDSIS